MILTRRTTLLGLIAGGLQACAGGPAAVSVSRETTMPTAPNPAYDAWVANFRPRAMAQGISGPVFDRAFASAGFTPGVVERDRNQTEFTRTLEDYLQIAAGEKKVQRGRAAFARQQGTLQAIETRYGVPAEIVAAVWGLESDFGERRGAIPIVSSLSTLAYDGRRGEFFERQLVAALKILQSGDTTPDRMFGSWAGAMGHTQFMPTSYQAYAVDYTGDGRRDIWGEDPTDALASTANYLARNGWRRGEPWGRVIASGSGGSGGSVIQPQPGGPQFRVYHNFNVIKRYNPSTSYALGVGHLADRLTGAPPIEGPFPPDRYGLVKDQRMALQSRLNAAGFDAGEPDGVIGGNTEAAIRAYQQSRGLPVTGTPSLDLLRQLGG
ncbi:lytic murein transglycosylase [Palleronia abyssalis]|uniref:Membrane-bound lytic murein transglycosylase B n=1 Tax=Palleronia abyssalis TaxID=1501240 RepID=A0A2R8C1Z2_9RHOB|nr:lytic murein transglycosylase [Palleronia abyssalis]SPJ26447.1 Membrane-bound lytic murein transglycosylase B [Palleronia abyssalis]